MNLKLKARGFDQLDQFSDISIAQHRLTAPALSFPSMNPK
jgi:hypothetical protein